MTTKFTLLGALVCLSLIGCSSTEDGDLSNARPDTTETKIIHPDPTRPAVLPLPGSIAEEAETVSAAVDQPALKMHREGILSSLAVRDRCLMGGCGDFRLPGEPLDREAYSHFDNNPIHLVSESPVSTFSIDVDTASYSNIRRIIAQGSMPRADAVRVEEMINYFSYGYPNTGSTDDPFSVYTEIGPSPWHPNRHLLHVGIKGHEIPEADLPPANLVFLIDVSGSMQSADKLALLKTSMKMLIRRLSHADRVAIVVYAGAAGTVLEPTSGSEQATILSAIDRLSAGGSTNGGAGIRLAYSLAEQGFITEGVNRVILATDGDFNVGTTDNHALKNLVESKRVSGVALSVLGFGSGNYNDALMQELAQIGNGNAAYIDTLNEARKVLVDEIGATLNIIARDVKIQIEFNPQAVEEYRLIGYETRYLSREDFNNDAVDAGDIGAGHTVTALYEVALKGSGGSLIDPLRYGNSAPASAEGAQAETAQASELAYLKLRYKLPDSEGSRLISRAIVRDQIVGKLPETSDNYRFSAAVAGFGQILRGGEFTGEFDLEAVGKLAASARGNDDHGYRGEFLGLLRTAEALSGT